MDPAFLPNVGSKFHRSQEIVLPTFCANPSGEREFKFIIYFILLSLPISLTHLLVRDIGPRHLSSKGGYRKYQVTLHKSFGSFTGGKGWSDARESVER